MLRSANLDTIKFYCCEIRNRHRNVPLDASWLQARQLKLNDTDVVAQSRRAAIELGNAAIDVLDCSGTRIDNSEGPALRCPQIHIGEAILLRHDIGSDEHDGARRKFRATGFGNEGTVSFEEADIIGRLDCSGAHITNTNGPALFADGMSVRLCASFSDEFQATGSGEDGTVRMIDARIEGQLDLSSAVLNNTGNGAALSADGLWVGQDAFLSSGFTAITERGEEAVRVIGARIEGQFDLSGASLSSPSGAAFWGDDLRVGQDLIFSDSFQATACNHSGAIRLNRARVSGQLKMVDTTIDNANGPALELTGLVVEQDLLLTALSGHCQLTGSGPQGTIQLGRAQIGGLLHLSDATIINDTGPAIRAEGMRTEKDLLLTDTLTLSGTGEHGALRLVRAHAAGQVAIIGTTITNTSGPAVSANTLHVERDLTIKQCTVDGQGPNGAVDISNALVCGRLDFSSAVITNRTGPALVASELHVLHGFVLKQEFTATGTCEHGAIRLNGAHIGGQLDLSSACVQNTEGPALWGDGLRVNKAFVLSDLFRATGAKKLGTVRLPGAHIGGQLRIVDSELTNDSGPALFAEGIRVDKDLILKDGSVAGSGDSGAIVLSDGHIGGRLDLSAAKVLGSGGPALVMQRLLASQDVLLEGEFTTSTHASDTGVATIDLTNTRILGVLRMDLDNLVRKPNGSRINAEGLTYCGVPEGCTVEKLYDLFQTATPRYAEQPYRQLAAALQAAGDRGQARNVLIARCDDLHRRGPHQPRFPRLTRLRFWFTRKTVRYGYKPWYGMAYLAAAAGLLVIFGCVSGALEERTTSSATSVASPPAAVGQQYPIAGQHGPADAPCGGFGYAKTAFDLVIPLVKTSGEAQCVTRDNLWGRIFYVWRILVQLVFWALGTATVAVMTNAAKNT